MGDLAGGGRTSPGQHMQTRSHTDSPAPHALVGRTDIGGQARWHSRRLPGQAPENRPLGPALPPYNMLKEFVYNAMLVISESLCAVVAPS